MVGSFYAGDSERGAVYVYGRTDGEWQLQQRIEPDGPRDFLGSEIGLDGNTAMIYGSRDVIYAYERVDGRWVERQRLTAPEPLVSIGLDGNVAAFGVESEDDQGAVYVFERRGDRWTRRQRLTPDRLGQFDVFGSSVAVDRDTILVGDRKAGGTGAAYVFERGGRTWAERQKLTPSDGGEENIQFGDAVAMRGRTAIIGAPVDNEAADAAGAAYVFQRTTDDRESRWEERQKLIASDAAEANVLGGTVDIDDAIAIIGSWRDDEEGEDAGAAHVFRRTGHTWIEHQKLTASDAEAGDAFGQQSVAIDPETAVVGAEMAEDGFGVAYVFADPALLTRNAITRAKYGLRFDELSAETSGEVQEIFDRQPFAEELDVTDIRTRDELAQELYGEPFNELSRRTTIEIQAIYDSQYA